MSWNDFTLRSRLVSGIFLWLVLLPFFLGIFLGGAGLAEEAFWVTVIGFIVIAPLIMFGSALGMRLFRYRAPETFGQFELGEPKRSISVVTRLTHNMTVMTPDEVAEQTMRVRENVLTLAPLLGQRCQDCGHIELLLNGHDGERIVVTTPGQDPWQWHKVSGVGLFAVETRPIEFAK